MGIYLIMFRPIIRSLVITAVALWTASELAGGGIIFERGFQTFVIVTAALSVSHHIIRPILNLLLLPVNLVSLGMFRWVTSVLLLYLITLLIPEFKITFFDFAGVSWQGVNIPAMHFSGIGTLLVVSLVISFISSFFIWLSR